MRPISVFKSARSWRSSARDQGVHVAPRSAPRLAGAWDTHEFAGKRFTALELIDDGPLRSASMRKLLAGIDAQKRAAHERENIDRELHRTPDVVWALNLLREGSDYPALARGILMAPRGAMLDTLQMLGRLLRDCPGKERVELDIVLPTDVPAAVPKAHQVSTYLQYLMSSLLIEWQFRGFGSENEMLSDDQRRELLVLERGDVQQQLAEDLVDATIRFGDTGMTAEEEAERIAEDVVTNGQVGSTICQEAKETVRHHLRCLLVARRVPVGASRSAIEVEENLVGQLRSFVGRFGYEDLRKLREELGRPSHVTIEQVRDAMRDFRRRHGRWPRHTDAGEVPGIGGSWASVAHALRRGFRGLPGGSSLFMERDGVVPRQTLTMQAIKDAVMAFHKAHGSWPRHATRERSPLGYCWAIVDRKLKKGLIDEAPKGSSLTAIVRECQGRSAPIRLTLKFVEELVRTYHSTHGEWPRTTTVGDVPIIGGPWKRLDVRLRLGLMGLPTHGPDGEPLSLVRLVAQLRGLPASSTPLTVEMVKASVLAWRRQMGEWPSRKTDGVAPMIGVRWCSLDGFLRMGRRGLPGGLNLTKVAKLLEKENSQRRARKATSSAAR